MIGFIKEYGLKLWITNKLIAKLPKKLKNTIEILKKSKNKQIVSLLTKRYNKIINKYACMDEIEDVFSENIWIFWWQGIENAPEIVKSCIKTIKDNCKQYKINIIDKNNIDNYLVIPEYMKKKLNNNEITITNFSDYLRMNLLKKYGGYWMDATIFLTDNPFEKINNGEFFTVKFHKEDNLTFISKGKWCVYFIGGKNQIFYDFMVEFFDEYFKKQSVLIDYFFMDYVIYIAYNNVANIRKKFDLVPYNNERINELISLLNNTFSKEHFDALKQENCIHKLSYKRKIDTDNKKNYYNRVILMKQKGE